MKYTTPRLLAVLAAMLAGLTPARAAYQLDSYAPPNNYSLPGLNRDGSAVGVAGSGYVRLPASPGVFVNIGGNSGGDGFGGTPDLSASGARISGNATAANGFSQAAVYDVSSGSWATLGGLGFNAATLHNGIQEQSVSNAISADGNVVVGAAYFNTSGTTATRTHPVVFRGGSVIDLNPSSNTQTGAAVAVSGDGRLVSGYTSTTAAFTLWTWSGNSYVASTPRINNAAGTPTSIQLTQISENGVYAAGGSVNALATSTPGGVFSPATLWNTSTQTGKLIPYDHVINTAGGDAIANMKTHVAGVSNNGLVVGSFNINLGGSTPLVQSDAWIYDDSKGVSLSFDAYLAGLGLPLAPTQHVWNLFSISSDGSAIAGIYFDSATSQSSTFLLHTAAAVPEPASWALMTLAVPLLFGLARRRECRA